MHSAYAVDKVKSECGVSSKTLKSSKFLINSNMKKSIVFVLAVIALSACSKGSKVGGYQDHLKTSPKVNFHHNDNGGCGGKNN